MIGVNEEIIQLELHSLGMTRKHKRLVFRVLSDGNKMQRLNICLSSRSRHNKASSLDQIHDENWVIYGSPKGKQVWLTYGSISSAEKPSIYFCLKKEKERKKLIQYFVFGGPALA